MLRKDVKNLRSIAQGLLLSLLFSFFPNLGAFASVEAGIVSLESVSTVREVEGVTVSGFDVVIQFGEGTLPDIYLVACEIRLTSVPWGTDPNPNEVYPVTRPPGYENMSEKSFGLVLAQTESIPVTISGSVGTARFDVALDSLRVHFFRVIDADQATIIDQNGDGICQQSFPPTHVLGTSAFKMALAPLTTNETTNPWNPDTVHFSDRAAPLDPQGDPPVLDSSRSVPVATFPTANEDESDNRFIFATMSLRATIDGEPEQVEGSDQTSCGRDLSLSETFPLDWFGEEDVSIQVSLCSWDDLLTQSEFGSSSPEARSVSFAVWSSIPSGFPHPTNGYGVSGSPSIPNPAFFTMSPITTDLTFDYVPGNAMDSLFELERTSPETVSVTLDLTRAIIDSATISGLYLFESRGVGAFSAGANLMGSQSIEQDNTSISFDVQVDSNVGLRAFVVAVSPTSIWRSDIQQIVGILATESQLQEITLSAGANATLFPAFDPDVREYYLNISSPEFQDFVILVENSNRGGQTYSYSVSASCAITPLASVILGATTTYGISASNFCASPPPGAIHGTLVIRSGSEAQLEAGEPLLEEYVIRILRPSLAGSDRFLTYFYNFDLSEQSRWITPERWLEIPGPGESIANLVFGGWENLADPTRVMVYQPGDIILQDRGMLLYPLWLANEPAITLQLGVADGCDTGRLMLIQDDDGDVDYVTRPAEINELDSFSYSVCSLQPYRISLLDENQTPISRFSNHASMSHENLYATSTSFKAHPGCVADNDCPLSFEVLVEAWDFSLDQSFSYSFQVMRPTSSGQTCLTMIDWSSPNSGHSDEVCLDEPGWIFPQSFDGRRAIYDEQTGYRLVKTSVSTSVRFGAFRGLDDEDGFGNPAAVPLHSDLTLYGGWETEDRTVLTGLTLFGVSYDVVVCSVSGRRQTISYCLTRNGESEQRYEPDAQGNLLLFQDVSSSDTAISASWNTPWWGGSEASLLVLRFGEAETSTGTTRSAMVSGEEWSDLEDDLCPDGYCANAYFVQLDVQSKFDASTLRLGIIDSSATNPWLISYSTSGGVGPVPDDYSSPSGFFDPGPAPGVTKAGFIQVGWRNSFDDEYPFGEPMLIFSDVELELIWAPAFHIRFMDGFSSSPVVEFLVPTSSPIWDPATAGRLPDVAHPLGYDFLGWTLTQSSIVSFAISTSPITVPGNLVLFPIWDLPVTVSAGPVTLAPSQTGGVEAVRPIIATPGVTGSPTVSPTTGSNTASSSQEATPAIPATPSTSAVVATKSTTLALSRVNGSTRVSVGLPAKYAGGRATIEVKRWINNRVRYFVIGRASVARPTSSSVGNSQLNFNFRLALRPTDVVRVKVGKTTVMNKRLNS